MALSREDFMKKLTSILATMALGVGLISTPVIAQDKGTVGIAMPTKSSARWISDGNSMVDQFTAAGYATDLQYAEDDIPNQLAQIENMITKGVDVLVIAAIDGTTLSNALENAAASGIKVIAYDRLIRESGNVDYYATFDNFKVGVQQASSLVDGLKARFGDGPYNVELFGGSPDDNNAFFFYNGAMSVLQPMIDSGDIVIVSGQMGMDKVGTLRWDGAVAQARMDNLLSAHYTDKQIHGVLSPYDGLSIGILSSLKGVGYGSGDTEDADRDRPGRRSPFGQVDPGGRAVFDGVQGHPRACPRYRRHGRGAAAGRNPEINDTSTYDNGVKVVESYLLEPVSVDKSNWEEILIGSGYYTMDQIK
jgi:putative multiple sugar transport system substrate-binding protein